MMIPVKGGDRNKCVEQGASRGALQKHGLLARLQGRSRRGKMGDRLRAVSTPAASGLNVAPIPAVRPTRTFRPHGTSPAWYRASARAGPPSPMRRAACPAPIVFQLGLVARPCPRHGPQSLLWAFDRPPKPASGRLKGSSPFDGLLRPDELPAETLHQRRRSTSGRRSVGDRSLRQQRRGDTIEAIAPDAAALRSRHVARRMDCGSSWTLPRITAVAVVDVGRAQLAARCAGGPPRVKLPTGAPLHCAMLRRNSALRFSCA